MKPLPDGPVVQPVERTIARRTVRHIVLLRFASHSTAADIASVEEAFAALAGQIDEVRRLEWGTNCSPESLDQGFTHGFTLDFDGAAERDTYLVHPRHQAFSAFARPHLADVLVIDFVVRKEPTDD